MIREQAKRTPKGQWVRVIGAWSPHQFVEKRMPTVAELNAAAPDTPVLVLFLYSQGLLNRAGVEALGLTAAEPTAGGRTLRVRRRGRRDPPCRAEPGHPVHDDRAGCRSSRPRTRSIRPGTSTASSTASASRAWSTRAAAATPTPSDYEATEALAGEADFPIRISEYLFAQKAGTELQDYEKWTAQEKLNLNLAIDRLDGYVLEGAGENLVWSAGDFENFLAPRPELAERMEHELAAVTRLLARHQWPIRIHATYDESISRVLDVFEPVFRETGYKARWCIDHAETISPAEHRSHQGDGRRIAVQNRMAFAGEIFAERYGKEAAASAPPLRRLLDAGIPLGAGTDATRVSSHNPWLSLYWMVTGKTVGGTQLASAENRLTREEALRLYTSGSAWFSGEEGVKGRIAPGQYADFAVLSDDYFAVAEEQIRSIESVLTVVGGDVVYSAPPFHPYAPAPLPPVRPSWSPVAAFGGYQRPLPEAGAVNPPDARRGIR